MGFIGDTRMLLTRYFGLLLLRPAAFDKAQTHATATEKFVGMLVAETSLPSGLLANLCGSLGNPECEPSAGVTLRVCPQCVCVCVACVSFVSH